MTNMAIVGVLAMVTAPLAFAQDDAGGGTNGMDGGMDGGMNGAMNGVATAAAGGNATDMEMWICIGHVAPGSGPADGDNATATTTGADTMAGGDAMAANGDTTAQTDTMMQANTTAQADAGNETDAMATTAAAADDAAKPMWMCFGPWSKDQMMDAASGAGVMACPADQPMMCPGDSPTAAGSPMDTTGAEADATAQTDQPDASAQADATTTQQADASGQWWEQPDAADTPDA